MVMKKIIVLSFLLLVGCDEDPNVLPDGNVTTEEAEIMQQSWCEYNEGRDFAKEQCKNYW